MYTDPSGHIAFFVVTMLIGAVVGAAAGVGIGYLAGYEGTDLIAWGIGGALIGAAVGTAVGMAISYSATGSLTSSYAQIKTGFALRSEADRPIWEALQTLDRSGIKPGQTSVSKSRIMEIYNSYNPLSASSSYTNVNGSLYVTEGHHTTIANVLKYGKLNTGPNMGSISQISPSATNKLWTTLIIKP